MLSNIFLKTLRDQRNSFMLWSIGISALMVFTILFYPSVADSSELDDILNNMPEAFAKLFAGEVSDFTSPEGYLNSQLFVLLMPLLFLFFSISYGSGAIAGEEERGTLDLLLSYPLKRSRVLLEKFAAMVVIILAFGFVFWFSIAVSAVSIGMHISLWRVAEATLSGVCLGLVFGTLALTLGCSSHNRGFSIGATSALGVAAYFLNALAPVVNALEPLQKLSLFYYYIGADPLSNGLDPVHVLVLLGLTVILLAVALLTFNRHDLVA
jgi:ABC-2 type transport system permease protein